jgi:hypothetical protein
VTKCTWARIGEAYAFPTHDARWGWACACGSTGYEDKLNDAFRQIETHEETGRKNAWEVPDGQR